MRTKIPVRNIRANKWSLLLFNRSMALLGIRVILTIAEFVTHSRVYLLLVIWLRIWIPLEAQRMWTVFRQAKRPFSTHFHVIDIAEECSNSF